MLWIIYPESWWGTNLKAGQNEDVPLKVGSTSSYTGGIGASHWDIITASGVATTADDD
jgi:hypothetical protein